jgi:hypothetical protein
MLLICNGQLNLNVEKIRGETNKFQNGPMKAKFAQLCISGCCRFRNTLIVKLAEVVLKIVSPNTYVFWVSGMSANL